MSKISNIKIDQNTYDIRATAIPYGVVDNTSTSTAYTVTVPGITELTDGVCCLIKNGKVTSESGFTLNVNGLGAKPSYSNMATGNPVTPTNPTRDTTIFNINYTMLFIYSSTLVEGGAWICYRGYDANTNTIGYQVRSNSHSLPASQKFYRYRLLFTSADGTHYVPANTSSSTNATASRTVNQTPIDPFGHIVYYGTTAAVDANARPAASSLWIIYTLSLGYSFNKTGAALTLDDWAPVYLKCAPQANGSAIIDETTPYVQALPTTADGKIYIFLGVAYSATSIELLNSHPVYYHDGTGIRIWTGKTIPSKTSELTNDSNFVQSTSLATVATSGSYNDLTNKPTIPAAITVDSTITQNGTNPVQGGAIYSALEGKMSTSFYQIQLYNNNGQLSFRDMLADEEITEDQFKTICNDLTIHVKLRYVDENGHRWTGDITTPRSENYWDFRYIGFDGESYIDLACDSPTDPIYIDDSFSQYFSETYVPQTRKINNKPLSTDITLTASDVGALPSNTHIPNDIKVGSVAGKLYRNDVNGGGNFTVKGNSGCIPNLTAGTFLVSVYAKSSTQSYSFRFNFGSVTYDLSTTNGEINDVRQITIPSSGTFSGSVLNGSVAPGTILYVVMYDYLTPVSTVGVAAVTNRHSDLDGIPNGTLTIQKNGTTVGTFTANQSSNTTANITVPTTASDVGAMSTSHPANAITSIDITNWDNKQSELVSGTNIKTINGQSLLGSGGLTPSDIGVPVMVLDSVTTTYSPVYSNIGKKYFGTVDGVEAIVTLVATNNFLDAGLSTLNPSKDAIYYAKDVNKLYRYERVGISSDGQMVELTLNKAELNGDATLGFNTKELIIHDSISSDKYIEMWDFWSGNHHELEFYDGTSSLDYIFDGTNKYIATVPKIVTVSTSGAITLNLLPNTFYKFTGSITSLTLTLNSGVDLCIYAGKFTAGSDDMPLVLPSGVIIPDESIEIESGKTYEFNIIDNVCIINDVTYTSQ